MALQKVGKLSYLDTTAFDSLPRLFGCGAVLGASSMPMPSGPHVAQIFRGGGVKTNELRQTVQQLANVLRSCTLLMCDSMLTNPVSVRV